MPLTLWVTTTGSAPRCILGFFDPVTFEDNLDAALAEIPRPGHGGCAAT